MTEYVVEKEYPRIMIWRNNDLVAVFYVEEVYDIFVKYALERGEKFWIPSEARYEE